MSFELTLENRGDYLYFHVTGPNSPESVAGYMNRIREECEKQDCHRILIDENLEGARLDMMEMFALITGGTSEALGFFDAIAYVDAQQDFEAVKFAETVAVNRGIPIVVFRSVEDAENWISERPEGGIGEDIFISDSQE